MLTLPDVNIRSHFVNRANNNLMEIHVKRLVAHVRLDSHCIKQHIGLYFACSHLSMFLSFVAKMIF